MLKQWIKCKFTSSWCNESLKLKKMMKTETESILGATSTTQNPVLKYKPYSYRIKIK